METGKDRLFPVVVALWAGVFVCGEDLFRLLLLALSFSLLYLLLPPDTLSFPAGLCLPAGITAFFFNSISLSAFLVFLSLTHFSCTLFNSRTKRAVTFALLVNLASISLNTFFPVLALVQGALLLILPFFALRGIREKQKETETKTRAEPVSRRSRPGFDPALLKVSKKIRRNKKVKFSELSFIWCGKDEKGEVKKPDLEESKQGEEQMEEKSTPKESESQKGQIVEAVKTGEADEKQKFKNPYVERIYKEFLPHVISDTYRQIITCLLEILERSADIPSVSAADPEKELPENSFDIFAKITLAEHTLNVCEEMFSLVKEKYGDTWQVSWGQALAVAVAHDLGKAGISRQEGVSFYGEHAKQSAEIFMECAGDLKEAAKLQNVIALHHTAVHRGFGDENLLLMLREADSRARKKEFKQVAGDYKSIKEIDLPDFIAFLYEKLRKELPKANPKSIPFSIDTRKGLLFIAVSLFTDSVKKYCTKRQIYFPEILSKDDNEVVGGYVRFFRDILSPADLIPSGPFSPVRGGYFRVFPVRSGRRALGNFPFVVLMLSVFCHLAGVDLHEFIREFKESAISTVEVG